MAAAWLATASATAQLPIPKLTWIFPAGLRAGTTGEVTVAGTDLDDLSRLASSDPRLSAQPKPGSPTTFTVVVPAEVPTGLIEFRAIGRFGASNPRPFAIGDSPEVVVLATNTSIPNAVDLPLDTLANSRVQSGQVHWYRFPARPSQRLIVRLAARELDSRLVADLAVFNPAGRELAVARRSHVLDFTAPQEGPFLLRISDQTYRGGDDFIYRVRLDAGPAVDFTVPMVLPAGTRQAVTIFGRNLPGGTPSGTVAIDGAPLERLGVDVMVPALTDATLAYPAPWLRRPAAAALPWPGFQHQLTLEAEGTRHTLSLGFLLAPSSAKLTALTTNGLAMVSPPAEVAGLFPARGELAGARFEAHKGDVLWLEVFAERLGFNVDPRLLVQRVQRSEQGGETYSDLVELNDLETNAGARDFDTTSRDVAGRFQAPEDGTYRVLVRDLFQPLTAPRRLPFHLSLRREARDFRLVAYPQPPPRLNDADRQVHLWATTVRRGETQPIRVLALRQDGFDGEITLTATNLPPGLGVVPARIAAGQNATSLLLTAATDAPGGVFPLQILGTARSGDSDLAHNAVAGSLVWHIPDWDQDRGTARPVRQLTVSICDVESAPLTLAVAGPVSMEVSEGGKVTVPYTLRRHDLFPGAFSVKAYGHPEVEKIKELNLPEKATNAVWELNLAETKLPAGTHTLWLQGLATGKYRNQPEALGAAEAALKTAEAAVATAVADAKPAAEAQRAAAETRRKAAEERAKPRDVTVAIYSQPFTLVVRPPPVATKP